MEKKLSNTTEQIKNYLTQYNKSTQYNKEGLSSWKLNEANNRQNLTETRSQSKTYDR